MDFNAIYLEKRNVFRRIIVPVDGSEISKKAAKKGLELAQ